MKRIKGNILTWEETGDSSDLCIFHTTASLLLYVTERHIAVSAPWALGRAAPFVSSAYFVLILGSITFICNESKGCLGLHEVMVTMENKTKTKSATGSGKRFTEGS